MHIINLRNIVRPFRFTYNDYDQQKKESDVANIYIYF